MAGFVKPTEAQRKAIFLIEALGLLHDVGKLSDQFIKSQASDVEDAEYRYKLLTDPRKTFKDIDLDSNPKESDFLRNWMTDAANDDTGAPFKKIQAVSPKELSEVLGSALLVCWDGNQYNLAELFPLSQQSFKNKKGSLHLLFSRDMTPAILVGSIHGSAHYEKESNLAPNTKQEYENTYLSSPFGFEQRIPVETQDGLTQALISLPFDRIGKIATERRETWLKDVKAYMIQGLAETRRPMNEVTLWDWGFIVAAMSKSAAAWLFHNEMPNDFGQLAWRTLCINLDILGLFARSDTISDLLGMKKAISDSFADTKTLIEETYAISNRFYRDETGEYYMFPAVEMDNELRDEVHNCFPSDLKPQIHMGSIVTASDLDPGTKANQMGDDPVLDSRDAVRKLLSEPRQAALKMQEYPVHSSHNLSVPEREWKENRPSNSEVCMVCGFYPVAYPPKGSSDENRFELRYWATEEKAVSRNICRICLDRRGRRSEDWVKGAKESNNSTIWTSEVGDENGRLALVVGSLGLEGWLDGRLLSSIYTIPENDKKGKTKHASPVRLHRIAEASRSFWNRVTEEITPQVVGQRPFRLSVDLSENELRKIEPKLGAYHAYEIEVEGVSLEAIWEKEARQFITGENLARFVKKLRRKEEDLSEYLKNKSIKLQERGAPGRAKQEIGQARISHSEALPSYHPTIPLISDPGLCMFLVPADKAFELAQEIKGEYERHMGRVRDRLPMHLGLIFFPRRTSIRAVLEAGRSMLKMGAKEPWDNWRIDEAEPVNDDASSRTIRFENGVRWEIPTKAGDEKTSDEWYPNFYTSEPSQNADPSKLKTIHINSLAPSEVGKNRISLRPSRFDFEFLDTTGRRFEIRYDMSGNRIGRPTRPFFLEDLDRLSDIWDEMKHLNVSQRYQVIHAIESTREAWFDKDLDCSSWQDPIFIQFVQDTLGGAQWGSHPWKMLPKDRRQGIIAAGVKGELADLAELYMQIIKDK